MRLSTSCWGLLEAESESFSNNFTVLVISDISWNSLHFVSLHQYLNSFLDFVVVFNFSGWAGFSLLLRLFCSCSERGLLSGYKSRGFPLQHLLTVEHGPQSTRIQQLRHTGLAALQHVASSQTRIKPVTPALQGEFLTNRLPGGPCLNSWHYKVELSMRSHKLLLGQICKTKFITYFSTVRTEQCVM